jgi:hypothetical protein
MIKIGHLSVAFLPRKSEPARITRQTTVFTVLAFLFCVSAHSQIENSPAAPESSPNEGSHSGAEKGVASSRSRACAST